MVQGSEARTSPCTHDACFRIASVLLCLPQNKVEIKTSGSCSGVWLLDRGPRPEPGEIDEGRSRIDVAVDEPERFGLSRDCVGARACE